MNSPTAFVVFLSNPHWFCLGSTYSGKVGSRECHCVLTSLPGVYLKMSGWACFGRWMSGELWPVSRGQISQLGGREDTPGENPRMPVPFLLSTVPCAGVTPLAAVANLYPEGEKLSRNRMPRRAHKETGGSDHLEEPPPASRLLTGWGTVPGLPHCRRILSHLSHQGKS